MINLLRQSGFGLIVVYCIVRLYEYLWVHRTFPFMLQLIMLAGGCYILVRLWLFYRQGLRITLGEQGVAILLGMIGFALAGQLAFVGSMNDMGDIDTFTYTRNLAINSTFWMLAGAAMSMRQLQESVLRAVVLMGAMVIIVGQATAEGSIFIDYGQIIAESALESLSHLNVAEFVVFLTFLSYASTHRLRMLVFIVGVGLLFSLGGRSSLYFTIATVGIYELFRGGLNLRSFAALAGLGTALFLLLLVSVQFELIDPESKFAQQMLFTEGIEGDGSFTERQYISSNSIRLLPRQILFGDPTLIASNFGDIGSYLHNLLSVWQFFGLGTFLVMVLVLWACWRRMREALIHDQTPLTRFGALLLIYTLISVLAAKYVGFRLLWVSIGFWLLRPELAWLHEPRRRRTRHRRRRGLASRLRGLVGASRPRKTRPGSSRSRGSGSRPIGASPRRFSRYPDGR